VHSTSTAVTAARQPGQGDTTSPAPTSTACGGYSAAYLAVAQTTAHLAASHGIHERSYVCHTHSRNSSASQLEQNVSPKQFHLGQAKQQQPKQQTQSSSLQHGTAASIPSQAELQQQRVQPTSSKGIKQAAPDAAVQQQPRRRRSLLDRYLAASNPLAQVSMKRARQPKDCKLRSLPC
jgi:hypothetical protein